MSMAYITFETDTRRAVYSVVYVTLFSKPGHKQVCKSPTRRPQQVIQQPSITSTRE